MAIGKVAESLETRGLPQDPYSRRWRELNSEFLGKQYPVDKDELDKTRTLLENDVDPTDIALVEEILSNPQELLACTQDRLLCAEIEATLAAEGLLPPGYELEEPPGDEALGKL